LLGRPYWIEAQLPMAMEAQEPGIRTLQNAQRRAE
jgi:hypothetical protein